MHYVTVDRPKRFGLTDEFLYDILTIAAEGGIGYWANYKLQREEDSMVMLIHDITDAETGEGFPETGDEPGWVSPGGLANAIEKVLNREDLVPARFAERLVDCVRDNDACELDADDCDALVQIALFGEVIYG